MNTQIEIFLIACAQDNVALVNKMLDAGLAVDIQAIGSSYTGLLRAAMVGAEGTCALLIARGADVNNVNQPLHYAALFRRDAICTALTLAGADTSAADAQGNTPLHIAAEFGWTETCVALFEAGSDIHKKNHKEKSALELANSTSGALMETFRASAQTWALAHAVIANARAYSGKSS